MVAMAVSAAQAGTAWRAVFLGTRSILWLGPVHALSAAPVIPLFWENLRGAQSILGFRVPLARISG